MSGATGSDWRRTRAPGWARTVVEVLRTTYPYAAQHVSRGPDDVDVTPTRLHPAFHGSFDWHSSVHMQWSGVRLLGLAGEHLEDDVRRALVEELDGRLTPDHVGAEAAYLRDHPHYERPYGWAWAMMLAAATVSSPLPQARSWAAATKPLADTVADLVLGWLPRLAYPVRSGEHANTAFGLALVHEAAVALGRDDVVAAVGEAARAWFSTDRDYPTRWEPGGSDFLSPALSEADLMRRVLAPDELRAWLAGFLPGLAAADDPLLAATRVLDPTDGKAVHLHGLSLSRAWQLRGLSPSLPGVDAADADARRARVEATTRARVEQVEREITAGDFMSTHWLVSFALLAETAAERPPSRAEPE